MTVMVTEVYHALKTLGLDEELAEAAAKAVLSAGGPDEVVTRSVLHAELADIRTEMAEIRTGVADLKTDLIKWTVGALLSMTAIFAGIVKLL